MIQRRQTQAGGVYQVYPPARLNHTASSHHKGGVSPRHGLTLGDERGGNGNRDGGWTARADAVRASALGWGDVVYVDGRPRALTQVQSFLANVEHVDLRFIPDHPLETRLLSRWRILTKGAARGRCGRTAVFLIDGSLFEQHRTPASKEQAETQAVRGSGNGNETASSTRFIGSSF